MKEYVFCDEGKHVFEVAKGARRIVDGTWRRQCILLNPFNFVLNPTADAYSGYKKVEMQVAAAQKEQIFR